MSGRKVAVVWVCVLVCFATVAFAGGVGLAASAAVNAEFNVVEAGLEETTIEEGESATVTATVENVGTETGTFTAELETDADGVVDAKDVEVEAGETEDIEFTRTFDDAGTYRLSVSGELAGDLTVTEPASAEFTVTEVRLSESEIEVDDSVDVAADVENTGDADGTYTPDLVIDGTVSASKSVEVDAGETETVTFTRSFDTAGEYAVTVGDASPRTLTVTEPANVSVTDASLSTTRTAPGDEVAVTATAVNDGGSPGEITATLRVDGTARESATRTLDPGASTAIEFTTTFEEAGEYDVSVNDAAAGTLTVSEPAAFEVSNARLRDDEILSGDATVVSAEVTNVGDVEGTFTAEARVTGPDGNARTVSSQSVTLGGGESEPVDLPVTIEEPGEYEVAVNETVAGTLTVDAPADLTVTEASIEADQVRVDDEVTVTAAVENAGDRAGNATVAVAADGEEKASTEVSLGPGEEADVELSYAASTAGEYDITVNGVSAGTLTVTAPANVSVTDASLSTTRIDPGDAVTVTATVVNDGGVSGEVTADLTVDGATRETETRTVGPGSETTIEFAPTFEETGTYEIAVNGAAAGTVTVSEPAAFETSNARLANDTVLAGDDAVVSVEVRNVGDDEGTFTAGFRATGPDGATRTVDARSVTLAGGDSQTVELRGALERPGRYDVSVNGTAVGTLTVEAPAALAVASASLDGDVVSVGDEVTVAATVENTGDRTGNTTVAVAADGEERAASEVTVGPGDSVGKSLSYNATAAGEYEITVNGVSAGTLIVIRPATFRTANADVNRTTILEGQSTSVTATVVNDGSEPGAHSATLSVDGDPVETKEYDVGPGERIEVAFTRTFETAGEYALSVNNDSAGTATVLEPANVSIRDTGLTPETIATGESTAVTVHLANDGDVEGEFTTRLRRDAETLETVTRTVGPNSNETVRFDRTFETAGEYALSANDVSVGTLSVLVPADVSVGEATLGAESVEPNESVALTVALRNAGEATGRQNLTISLGDGTTLRRTASVPDNGTTVTVTHAYAATGEYAVAVNDVTVGNVTVAEREDDAGTGGGGGGNDVDDSRGGGGAPSGSSGGTGSSGSTGGTGATVTDGPEPTVVRAESDDGVSVGVEGATGERYEIAVDLAGPADARPALAVSSVGIDPAGDPAAYETTVGRPTAEPAGRDPVPRGTALGYVAFNSTLGEAGTTEATLRFTVDAAAIPQGLGQGNVAVLRYADGEWTTAGVAHDRSGDNHTVTMPHAAPVAVVALAPGRVDIVESELPADQVRVGYETTLLTTVENPGDRPATRTLTVAVNGESVAEREVSLEPGENATLEIAFEPPEGGTVSVAGNEVGSIGLFGRGDTETGSTEAGTETEEGAPGFGVIAAVLGLLLAAVAARVRRE